MTIMTTPAARHLMFDEAHRRCWGARCTASLDSLPATVLLVVSHPGFFFCCSFDGGARPVILPCLTRAALLRKDGTLLNTCTLDTLVEVLVHLKRAYW